MAGVMHVSCGPMRICKGTRIGQYLSFNAESLFNYNGDYGAGKLHDQKYSNIDKDPAILETKKLLGEVMTEEEEQILQQANNPVKRGRGRPFGTTKKKD